MHAEGQEAAVAELGAGEDEAEPDPDFESEVDPDLDSELDLPGELGSGLPFDPDGAELLARLSVR